MDMGKGRNEHQGTGGTRERGQELQWTPRSGEGSASALGNLKHAERLKAAWRRVRSAPAEDDRPTSAD